MRLVGCPFARYGVVSASQAFLYSLRPPTQPTNRQTSGHTSGGWLGARSLVYTRSAHPPSRTTGATSPAPPLRGIIQSGEGCRLDVCPFGRLLSGVCFAGLFIAPSAHPPSRPIGRQSGLLLRAAYARNCFCSRSPSLHGQTWLAIFNSLPYYGRGGRGARAKGGRPDPAPVDPPHPLLCGGLLWRALYTHKRGTQYGSVKPSSAPSRACPPLRAARALRSEPSAALPRCTTALHSGHGRLSAPDTHGSTLRAAGG